jgi:hypothetical protein
MNNLANKETEKQETVKSAVRTLPFTTYLRFTGTGTGRVLVEFKKKKLSERGSGTGTKDFVDLYRQLFSLFTA